jgi:hypothetical protein
MDIFHVFQTFFKNIQEILEILVIFRISRNLRNFYEFSGISWNFSDGDTVFVPVFVVLLTFFLGKIEKIGFFHKKSFFPQKIIFFLKCCFKKYSGIRILMNIE